MSPDPQIQLLCPSCPKAVDLPYDLELCHRQEKLYSANIAPLKHGIPALKQHQ